MKRALPILAILLIAFGLRVHEYAHYPVAGETADELAWTWLGESLLSGKSPTTWSWFGHYENASMHTLGRSEYRIVSPSFDNPPLFAFIPGLMAKLGGYEGIVLPSIRLIRAPMILLGVLNVALLYWVVKRQYNQQLATLSALLYATIPSFVLASRLVVAENLLITWLLVSWWLLLHANELKRPWPTYAAGLVAGLAVLTKFSGIIVLLFVASYLLLGSRFEDLKRVLLVALPVSSLWLVYGAYFGWDLFVQSFAAQTGRVIGWESVLNLFIHPNLVDKPLLDGWFYLGLLLLFGLFLQLRETKPKLRYRPPLLIFLWWLLFYVVSTDVTNYHGWYRYPLHPLMALLVGQLLLSTAESFMVLVLPLVLGVLPSIRLVGLFYGLTLSGWFWRWLAVLVVLGIPVADMTISKSWKKRLLMGVVLLMVAVNVAVVLGVSPEVIQQDYWRFFPPHD